MRIPRPDQPLDSPSRHITGEQSISQPLAPSAHSAPTTALEDANSNAGSPPCPPSERSDAEEGGRACFVCEDAAADAVLIECGHGGLCAGEAPDPHPVNARPYSGSTSQPESRVRQDCNVARTAAEKLPWPTRAVRTQRASIGFTSPERHCQKPAPAYPHPTLDPSI